MDNEQIFYKVSVALRHFPRGIVPWFLAVTFAFMYKYENVFN